jgi:two-component system, sensor histidine kinase and response regulator
VSDPAPLLLVDDQESNLTALASLLESFGEPIAKARSGREALRFLLERDFAVVLLDAHMPEMDGFETAALIRERDRTRDVPILFVTAIHQSDEDVRRGYSLGAVDYVFKPIEPEILRARVAVFLELFRRRRRERAALDELARSNRDLEEYAQVVAHDLQAPLRGVSGHLELLLRDCGSAIDETARHHVDRAAAGAARMRTQIRDLLEYARVRNRGATLEPVNVAEALDRALADLATPIEESSASITHGPLPTLLADPAQLGQLFMNLLDNAVKFRHSSTPHVHVSADRVGDEWRFSVADNGIGIDVDDQDRIFGVFTRLHTRDEFPGTGIGLAICRRIVERHGGRIWVDSKKGEGSAFRFTLPALAASNATS